MGGATVKSVFVVVVISLTASYLIAVGLSSFHRVLNGDWESERGDVMLADGRAAQFSLKRKWFGERWLSMSGAQFAAEPGTYPVLRHPHWLPIEKCALWGVVEVQAFGWPARVVRSSSMLKFTAGTIGAGEDRGVLRMASASLSIAPIWQGWAANTATYSAGGVTAMVLGGMLRSWFLRRRGCCVVCAYDLRGDFAAGCPECGWNKPRS